MPLRPLRLLLASPRGFCAGVTRAIDAVEDALRRHGAPIYVRRPIVHNLAVVRALEEKGAVFVDELDEVPAGSVVIMSAHGVAPTVTEDARRRNLVAFDAVCPLVAKVHREVARHHANGRHVILVGHAGHPEITGTLGQIPAGAASVVSSPDDVGSLPLPIQLPVAYAVQTTYSVEDARATVEAICARFADVRGPAGSDICYATTNRQDAIRRIAGRSDAVIVAGEHFSSNANRLAEAARSCGCPSVQLVASASAIDWSLLRQARTLGLSSAASTPEETVAEIISALAQQFEIELQEEPGTLETAVFKPLALS